MKSAIHRGVRPLASVATPSTLPDRPAWQLSELAGRLVELSGERSSAHLTAAFGLVLETQLCGDRAAWVTFESLPVVRITDTVAAGRAAEHLVRSGGFGLVVIDLSSQAGDAYARTTSAVLPVPLLTRLLGLARAHHAVLLLLTKKSPDTSSLNSLISLRADAQWSGRDGRYDVRVRALKDKRRAPGWDHVEACRGSVGMR